MFFFSAIFLGDEDAFKYATQATLINPYVGCIIQPILKHCLDILVSEYTEDTLNRAIPFLSAVVSNYHTAEGNVRTELFHLSQLFVCILLGPMNLNVSLKELRQKEKRMEEIRIKEEEEHIRKKEEEEKIRKKEEKINSIAKELENIKPMCTSLNVDDCEEALQILKNNSSDCTDANDEKKQMEDKINKIAKDLEGSSSSQLFATPMYVDGYFVVPDGDIKQEFTVKNEENQSQPMDIETENWANAENGSGRFQLIDNEMFDAKYQPPAGDTPSFNQLPMLEGYEIDQGYNIQV